VKNALWIASSSIALVTSLPAFAQDVATERDDDVIVVTAQKREQDITDVPVSISVVGGEQLQVQGAASLTDYAAFVPGMQAVSGRPGQTRITLRGVAPLSSAPTVGIYLDDAPVGSSSIYNRGGGFSLDMLPYDIERVEVLKGPQGTLYGASSIGGLLKYVTVAPNTNEFSVRGGVEGFSIKGGDGLGWAAQTRVNAPIVEDQLALTASFAWRSSPGWVDSVNNPALTDQNSAEQRSGRVALLWTPTPELSVNLSGMWQSIESEGNATYAASLAGNRLGNGRSNNNFLPESYTFSLEYYAATVDYDFGAASLTSVSTYSKTRSVQGEDATQIFGTLFPLLTGGTVPAGLSPFTIDLGLEKFTQEVRLASPGGGTFEWLIGGFYTHEDSSNFQIARAYTMAGAPIVGLDPLATVSLPATYKEYAAFANATLRFGEQFAVTGGVRWARNEQTFRQISGGVLVPTANQPGTSEEDVFTFSVSPQFNITEDAMIYARVASGYRPGGPNVVFPGIPPSVSSDKLTNYEVGVKANVGGLVTIDVAGFYMDWTDIQVVRSVGGINGTFNGGQATSKGIEGSIALRPVRGLTLTAIGSYTDATLSEDVPEIDGLDGDLLPAVPKFQGSFQADYQFDLGGMATGTLGGAVRHASSRLSRVESDPLTARAKPYTAVDLNASVTFDQHWTLRAYARNLLNDEGEMGRGFATNGLNQPIHYSITPLQPRTIGVALDLSF
jgi:iron complex outermembrane receptor protein